MQHEDARHHAGGGPALARRSNPLREVTAHQAESVAVHRQCRRKVQKNVQTTERIADLQRRSFRELLKEAHIEKGPTSSSDSAEAHQFISARVRTGATWAKETRLAFIAFVF